MSLGMGQIRAQPEDQAVADSDGHKYHPLVGSRTLVNATSSTYAATLLVCGTPHHFLIHRALGDTFAQRIDGHNVGPHRLCQASIQICGSSNAHH